MRCSISTGPRKSAFCRLAACLAAVAWIAGWQTVPAQNPLSGVARVEEDWELVVNDPDINDDSPQVTCVIAPLDLSSGYLAVDVNFHSQPDYSPGGVQMHVWSPNQAMLVANLGATNPLQTENETITWTTSMSLADATLTFAIVNGSSTTWGSFGNDSKLQLSVAAPLTDLAGYSSEVSLDNSGVPYASNRVTSLTLKAVRWYSASGALLQQNTTPQPVHPQN
ncbi:MAG TPA: hypothetical protein VN699_06245 [Pirellulales bacterium]|nr:hypothetical protein [Pirellulales bacterium]